MLSVRRSVLVGACTALALAIGGAGTASAHHHSCEALPQKPWPVKNASGNRIGARGAVELFCAHGTSGTIWVHLARQRWWGWERLDTVRRDLFSNGDSGFVSPYYYCNGDGTFTYRIEYVVSIYHPGAGQLGSNFVITERTTAGTRFSC
jgi:hypothetical protein